jgi:tetratricopeptide (TPR) repeat protein
MTTFANCQKFLPRWTLAATLAVVLAGISIAKAEVQHAPGKAPAGKEANSASANASVDKASSLVELKQLAKRASFAEARELLKNLLQKYPGDADVHLAAADLYAGIGSSGAAIDEYKKALALEPNNIKSHIALAQSDLANGSASEAVEQAHLALAIEPKSQAAQLVLVNALLKIGDLREADVVLKQILRQNGGLSVKNADVAYTAYQFYRKRRQFFIAQSYLDKAIALQPKQYQWLLDKADICQSVGDNSLAKQALEKLLTVDPYSIEALYKLGVLLEFYQHDYDGAANIYEKLIKIDPDYVAALTGLDRCRAKKNDIAGQLKLGLWHGFDGFRQSFNPQRHQ